MAFWSEIDGGRGVDEVASVVYQYVTNTYQPLAPGNLRTLIFWSDRCRGQTNNWQILCAFKLLITLGYFSQVEQKFLCTGHTFLPCDRLFALIEKRRKVSKAYIPDEWADIIAETRQGNPFQIQRMTINNIYDFKILERLIPRPQSLKVTEAAKFFLYDAEPGAIYMRRDYNPGAQERFGITAPNQRGRIANRRQWTNQAIDNFQLQRKYAHQIPISFEKFQDLISFVPYLLPQYRNFYRTLPHVPPPRNNIVAGAHNQGAATAPNQGA
jgi:hypothetical protein